MARNKGRGSSTRKYKKDYPISPKQKKVKIPIIKETLSPNKDSDRIKSLEDMIRSGKNFKGEALSNKDISNLLGIISEIEYKSLIQTQDGKALCT